MLFKPVYGLLLQQLGQTKTVCLWYPSSRPSMNATSRIEVFVISNYDGFFWLSEHFEVPHTVVFISCNWWENIPRIIEKFSDTIKWSHILCIMIYHAFLKCIQIQIKKYCIEIQDLWFFSVCTDNECTVSPGIRTLLATSLLSCLQSWGQSTTYQQRWLGTYWYGTILSSYYN